MNNINLEEEFDKAFPNCSDSLDTASSILGKIKSNEQTSKIKFFYFDIEELFCQTRYCFFEGIKQLNSEISNILEESEFTYISVNAALLSRQFVRERSKFNYENPNEFRRGKRVANWLFHIHFDNAIFRILAIMDRIANILALSANVTFGNDRVYFRSKKLEVIHREINKPETELLLTISNSDAYNLLVSYRDTLSHTLKRYSTGQLSPGDIIQAVDEKMIKKQVAWTQSELLDFGKNSFNILERSLHCLTIYIKRRYERS